MSREKSGSVEGSSKQCAENAAEFAREVKRAGGRASPPIDFQTFIISLGSSAMYHLDGAPLPTGEKGEQNLELAHQTIDILGLLEEKTRGNLNNAESKLLCNLLCDLRLRYVKSLGAESAV